MLLVREAERGGMWIIRLMVVPPFEAIFMNSCLLPVKSSLMCIFAVSVLESQNMPLNLMHNYSFVLLH